MPAGVHRICDDVQHSLVNVGVAAEMGQSRVVLAEPSLQELDQLDPVLVPQLSENFNE